MNANEEITDEFSQNVRYYAAVGRHLTILHKFSDFSVDILSHQFLCTSFAIDPMLLAIIYGIFDFVKYIWSKGYDFSLNSEEYRLSPYFHAACASGYVDQYPKFEDYFYMYIIGMNCLMHAASAGSPDVVNYLIKLGMGTDDITIEGLTAIVCSARSGSLSCVKALIKASTTYKNCNRKYNCVVEAATQGYLGIVNFLI